MSQRPSHTERTKRKRSQLIAISAVVLAVVGGIAWAIIALVGAAGASGAAAGKTGSDTDGGIRSTGLLGESVAMGGVEIRVADLETMQAFYESAVGLDVIEQTEGRVVLGSDERPLLTLQTEGTEDADGAVISGDELLAANVPSEAGLYHSAILFPTATDLAVTLQRIATVAPETFQGSADHLVSEAFYFGDPEGNGLELYVDRPREDWQWDGSTVKMGSEALDVNQFIAEHRGDGDASDAVMGHVHLRVGDTTEAKRFYSDIIGFDVTSESDGAVFMSAGGYHHHLAANSWGSAGAGVRPEATGLVRFTLTVGTADEFAGIKDRLSAAGVESVVEGDVMMADDPWGNTILVTTK